MHITGPRRWAGRQRWSIATRKSVNTCAALAAIATAIWMAGGKKRHEQRWSLVAALKKLSVPTFARRIAQQCFSRNGMHTAMLPLNSAKASPGIAFSTRESIYSKHLREIIGFGFAVQRKIYKSKCFGPCQEGANLLPILTP